MRTVYTIGCLALLLSMGSLAQAQQVQALVNETTIGTEESVGFTLEISGADFSDIVRPSPPEAEGLVLLSGAASQQTSMSIIGGDVTRSISFRWRYQPTGEGDARVLAANVEIGGETYTTRPIVIKVVPQAERPSRVQQPRTSFSNPFGSLLDGAVDQTESHISEGDIFVRAAPSAHSAYQNEQVTISYELFFRSDMRPRNSRLADSWDAEGFWREELDVEERPMPRTSVHNGVRFSSIVLKRAAVFPTRLGSLAVDPLRIETEVFAPRSAGDPFGRSLFSLRTPYESVERASASIRIESRPLPPGAPESFAGAVGHYAMSAEVSRTEVEVGEPLQLVLRISGQGNLAMLEGPSVELPGAFEAYDPEIQTSIASGGDLVQGSKTFTYLLVPRSNGAFAIAPVLFTYFDPRAEKYHTLRADVPMIRATGAASGPLAATATATGLPVDDIAGPFSQSRWVRFPATPLHRRAWIYVALVLPLLLLGLTALAHGRVTRLATDTAYARNRRAHPLARKHFKKAMELYRLGERRAFYEELERAVLGFIGNRINVAELGLTHSQLDGELVGAGVPEEARATLQTFLKTCDVARFAPAGTQPKQMTASLQAADQLLVILDNALQRRAAQNS